MIDAITNLYYEYYNDLNFTTTVTIFFVISVLFNITAYIAEFKKFSLYTIIFPIIHTIISITIALIVTIILDKTITPYFNLNYTARIIYYSLCYMFYMAFGIIKLDQHSTIGVFNIFDLLFNYAGCKIIHKSNVKEWKINYNSNINYINNILNIKI